MNIATNAKQNGPAVRRSKSGFVSLAEILKRGRFVVSKYEPPYDSPIETIFARNADKYFHNEVRLEKQVHVQTLGGKFILDFLATGNGRKVAFECDGKEFHDETEDEWRDAMIMGTGKVDEIYRLRGKDLVYRIEDCFYVISKKTPEIFSERGLINLETLTSEKVKMAVAWDDNFRHDPTFYIPSIDFRVEHRMDYNLDRQYWPILLKQKIDELRRAG